MQVKKSLSGMSEHANKIRAKGTFLKIITYCIMIFPSELYTFERNIWRYDTSSLAVYRKVS